MVGNKWLRVIVSEMIKGKSVVVKLNYHQFKIRVFSLLKTETAQHLLLGRSGFLFNNMDVRTFEGIS